MPPERQTQWQEENMEDAKIVYGRMLESAHITGVTFDRASAELKYLLDEDRWKELGFDDGSHFIRACDSAFSGLKLSSEERRSIVEMVGGIASQRAIAGMLGVSKDTVRNDSVKQNVVGENSPAEKNKPIEINELDYSDGENSPSAETAPEAESAPEEKKSIPTVARGTGDNESYTPQKYIDAARTVMGGIDLDPASNEVAQKTVGATQWFGVDDDGLTKDWTGRVFLNPPYAQPLMSQFVDKLCHEYEIGNVSQAIILTNNNTDTKWWQKLAIVSSLTCHTSGRINFYKETGETTSPTNGQTFFYFGGNFEAFSKRFSEFGLIQETFNGTS